MDVEKVEFAAERETALLTLYGKVLQSRFASPVPKTV
jgi:hypothetical protein